jgi:hypothetical protein
MGAMPTMGATIKGKNAVTETGVASEIHHVAIHNAKPRVCHAAGDIPSNGDGINKVISIIAGPNKSIRIGVALS